MPRNLKGYFAAKPNCKQYTVKIVADRNSNEFEEILLAGESPFVVTYDTSSTPFEPLRLSRASISVLADEKFFDVFSEDPQGTRVVLEDENGNVEWTGFLTSNLLNMPDGCGNEIFSLEAQDTLYTLEHYKYEAKINKRKKQIVSFKEILKQIATRCSDINTIIVDGSILTSGGSYIYMDELTVSEQNFFTSDTDEPWTLKEVLQELCKYLGFTGLQWKDRLVLFDMQAHTNSTVEGDTPINVQLHCEQYYKSESFNTGHYGTFPDLMNVVPLRESLIMGPQSDISLETIYNKVEVKDSFYEIDHFIPDLWDDNLLTNRQGDFWKCNQISRSGKFKYIGNGKPKEEEKDEKDHVYYMRRFDHRDYSSIYRNRNNISNVEDISNTILVSNVQSNQNSDWDTGNGYYEVTATFTNKGSSQATIYLFAELTYNWWDNEHLMPDYNTGNDDETLTIPAGASRTGTVRATSWWDDTMTRTPTIGFAAWYKINSGSKQYPISENNDDSNNYVGATIVDLAAFDKPMDNTKYNYETEANINFDRYLMIHQCGKPTDRQHPYVDWSISPGYVINVNPLKDTEVASYFPPIFQLNSGYTNPMIIDDKAYLYLDATAIFERYDVPYINPDWTSDNSRFGGWLGLFTKMDEVCTIAPCLIFTLKIGNKYWSTHSGWTTQSSCFAVNLSTDKTDTDDCDFSAWWNKDHTVLNNVEWTDWAGAKGYKIPLEDDMDWNQDIVFKVHMPSRQQELKGDYVEGVDYQNNNYCWVKDLKIGFTTKDKENYDNSDVLYRNIIDSGSVNTLSDITMKFTTYPGEGMHSYSNVGYNGKLIDTVVKTGLGNAHNKFEEQKIKAYVNQYSTNTIKQNLTLSTSIGPLDRIKDPTLSNKYFGIVGARIDYANGSQDLTLIETKPWQVD